MQRVDVDVPPPSCMSPYSDFVSVPAASRVAFSLAARPSPGPHVTRNRVCSPLQRGQQHPLPSPSRRSPFGTAGGSHRLLACWRVRRRPCRSRRSLLSPWTRAARCSFAPGDDDTCAHLVKVSAGLWLSNNLWGEFEDDVTLLIAIRLTCPGPCSPASSAPVPSPVSLCLEVGILFLGRAFPSAPRVYLFFLRLVSVHSWILTHLLLRLPHLWLAGALLAPALQHGPLHS